MSLRRAFNKLFAFTKYRLCTKGQLERLEQAQRSPYEVIARIEQGNGIRLIFDVGANVGQTTKEMRHYFNDAFIHAFEPTPECRDRYMALHGKDSHVKLWPFALSDKEGNADFFVNKRNMTNSLLPIWEPSQQFIGGKDFITNVDIIEVNVRTIDSFCREQGISSIDILKLDIQGSELNALKGAVDLLERHAIKYICLEAPFVELYHQQAFFHEIVIFLDRFGYRVYNLFKLARHKSDRLLFADALFMLEE